MKLSSCRIGIFLLLSFWACKKEIAPPYDSGCLLPYLSPSFPTDDPNFNCCDCGVDVQEVYSSVIPFDYL
ncbi:MAG TPA: hypothetical protein DCF33_07315 [Saprospirales bacterium]|nr:hypothetical protein [Saprospirales bacterium]